MRVSNMSEGVLEPGCSVNSISIDSLFDLYNRCGFLYPAKKERLLPYMAEIKANWEKILTSEDNLLNIFSSQRRSQHKSASLVAWKSSMNTMTVQHLTSDGMPLLTKAVLLGALSCFSSYSVGLWYNPQNKYTSRLFGRFPALFGESYVKEMLFDYFFVEAAKLPAPADCSAVIRRLSNRDRKEAFQLVKSFTGDIFAKVEEFDSDDWELNQLDGLYKKCGLSRKRQLLAAYSRAGRPLGIAIVHRGPLGLNFSFLENAGMILLRDDLEKDLLKTAMNSLLLSILPAYSNFPPAAVPILTNKTCSRLLAGDGHKFFREYKKVVWLKDLNGQCYQFIDKIYSRIAKRRAPQSDEQPAPGLPVPEPCPQRPFPISS